MTSTVVAATWSPSVERLPGGLHASRANIAGYVAPVSQPGTLGLLIAAFAVGGTTLRRRRSLG